MMTNHIFELLNVEFDFMFLSMNNKFLSPTMQISQYIIGLDIHNGLKFQDPRTSAYSP